MAGGYRQDAARIIAFQTKLEKELKGRLERAATYAETAVKMQLSKPGTGRTYRGHRASAPFHAPTVLRGVLRGSITHELIQQPGQEIKAIVGTNDKKAPWLEFGTKRVLPRPFLRVTIERIQAQLWRILNGEF